MFSVSTFLWSLFDWSESTGHFRRVRLPELVVPFIAFVQRFRYFRVRYGLSRRIRKRRLKVVFLIGDATKWKGQTVYESMLHSDEFDPYVAPTVLDAGFFADSELTPRLERCRSAFQDMGLRILDVCDPRTAQPLPLSDFGVDIVIYLQPWSVPRCQHPIEVARYALTFYLPYCVYALGDDRYEMFDMPFMRWLSVLFMQSKAWVEYFKSTSSIFRPGPELWPVGIPHCEMLQIGNDSNVSNVVIYAPHWSFHHKKNISKYYLSTFAENGQIILAFAKAHPEIHWIFRPHPGLRSKLLSTGLMTMAQVDGYFNEWRAIGEVSETGDYLSLFQRSSAMVTDCVTFLTEYLLTGKPLIRLVAIPEYEPLPPSKRLMDAFYEVRSERELFEVFDKVLIRHEDDMKGIRAQVVKDMGYERLDATEQIMCRMRQMLHCL